MNVLEKILEEILQYRKDNNLYAGKHVMAIEEIIRSHMDDVPKCGECSRRKWYQIGYEDAKKEDGWIPVSERLPEEGEECIITDKDGYVSAGIIYDYVDEKDDKPCFYKVDDEDWNCFKYNPIAWQPLPEPYKGS